MFRSFHLLPNVMHTHETLVLHRHHRSISVTPAIKKKKKKTFVQLVDKQAEKASKISKRKFPLCQPFERRNLTISSPSLPRNHETVHDPMTPPRATILRFLDFHFALLYLRSQTVTRLFENSARFFFFFIRPSFPRGFVEVVVVSRVSSFYFSANVVEKTEGKRAITSTRRSIIDRAFERSPVESSIIERSSRMQKGLQAGWGWREAGTIMPRLKDRFERW